MRLMRRGQLAALLLGFAAAAAPAAASTVVRLDGPSPVRLLSPLEGAPLLAGSDVELAWEPLPGFGGLAGAKEWEAFLSLDGGRSYPLRLTPHLDQDVRRVAWRVPALASEDARILLRLGDERREVAVALPQRFAIRAPAVALPWPDASLSFARRAAAATGEAALPGHPGVGAWVEGSRRGAGMRQVVAASWQSLAPAAALPELPAGSEGLAPPSASHELPAPTGAGSLLPRPAEVERTPGPPPARPCPDLLLLTQRQNE